MLPLPLLKDHPTKQNVENTLKNKHYNELINQSTINQRYYRIS